MGLFIPPEECRFDGLSLRCWKPGDGAALARAIRENYAHLAPWMKWPKANERAEDSEERVRSNYGQWLKNEDFVLGLWDGDEVIGGSGFHLRRGSLDLGVAELGMWCAATRAGTQLGTRTLKALLDWGFSEWHWERLEWRCDATNIASWRVAEKAGMTLEGTLRSNELGVDGSRRDTRIYAALR